MIYEIFLTASARKAFLSLDSSIQKRMALALQSLSTDPRPNRVKKLKGVSNFYRIRVSDYRIVCAINDRTGTIEIACIDSREDVYRGLE